MQFKGAWMVEYEDGTLLHQHDRDSEFCNQETHEVPYKAINWYRVKRVHFISQWCDNTVFDFTHPGEPYQVSMRARQFVTSRGIALICYIIITSIAGKEVDAESTVSAFYWFPDGSTHDCPDFDSSYVAQHAFNWVHGKSSSIMPIRDEVIASVDAVIGG